jgi:hypothetical protein
MLDLSGAQGDLIKIVGLVIGFFAIHYLIKKSFSGLVGYIITGAIVFVLVSTPQVLKPIGVSLKNYVLKQ